MSLALRKLIADDLIRGPAWARSYAHASGLIDRMVREGELARVVPLSGGPAHMIALTQLGAEKYARGREVAFIAAPNTPSGKRRVRNPNKAVAERKAAREAERAEQRDTLAEHVANGGTLYSAPLEIGTTTIDRRWSEIKTALGWQAS